jgi:hypothetical protein
MSMLGIKAYPIHRFTEEGALDNGYDSSAVVLVGSPIALSQFPGGRVDTDFIMRGGRSCDVVELTPGKRNLKLMYYLRMNGQIKSSGAMNVSREYEAGMVYRARRRVYEDKSIRFYVIEVGPMEFPSTDGNAVARFTRLTPPEQQEDAAFAYEISFKDGRTSTYPIYNFSDTFPLVSPDKESLALFNKSGDKFKIYIDGREKEYDSLLRIKGIWSSTEIVLFSPDSKHHAFIAGDGGKYMVVHDWEEGTPYEWVQQPKFSPDSKTLTYIVKQDEEKFLVVNRKAQKHYDNITSVPFFSPDSSRYLYTAEDNILVVDEKEITGYQKVFILENPFSPDSSKYYCGIKDENGFAIHFNGKRLGRNFDNIGIGKQVWSPDSSSILYWGMKDDAFSIMINDTVVAEVEDLYKSSLSFDEEGAHVIYKTTEKYETFSVDNPLK